MKTAHKKTSAKSKQSTASQTPGAQAGNSSVILEQIGAPRIILLISLFAFLAYANSLGGDFVFDDYEQIVENQDLRSWDNLGRAFTTDVWAFREKGDTANIPAPLPYYRPLFTALLTIEYQLFGLHPQLWHLMSLLLHIICSIELYFVILLLSRNKFASAIGSLVFAVHPVHAESVAWISGVTDPLFGVFFLASLYFYLRHKQTDIDSAQRRKYLLYSLLFFVISAFAKETALSLAILIFSYEVASSSASIKERAIDAFKRAIPFIAASMIYLIPRYAVLGERMLSNPQAPDRPLYYTLLTLPFVICSYLFHLIWPVGLSVTYDTRFITTPASSLFLMPAIVLALAAGFLIYFRRSISRQVWVALLLIFVPLLPVLNLGQISQEQYLVFDHYLYLSVAGLGYLAGLALTSLARSQSERLSYAAAAALVVLLAVGTYFENRAWSDSYSVWANASRVSPNYWAPHYNTALELIKRRDFSEARERLERAASLKPDEPIVYDALGRAHLGLGDLKKAEEMIKHALDLNPQMFESLNNLGTVYFEAKDYARAEEYFTQALRINSGATATRYNLARCFARAGSYEKAAREFELFLSSSPEDAEAWYELGLAYLRMNRAADAVRTFQRGLDLTRSQELEDEIMKSLRELKQ